MNTETKPHNGFAKVPHGIADAGIPDTLKLFLWLCFDRPADWTFSVAEVAGTMDKTPRCVQKYFRMFLDAGVFTFDAPQSGNMNNFKSFFVEASRVFFNCAMRRGRSESFRK